MARWRSLVVAAAILGLSVLVTVAGIHGAHRRRLSTPPLESGRIGPSPDASPPAPAMRLRGVSPRSLATPTPSPTPDLVERLAGNPMPPSDPLALARELRGESAGIPRVVRSTPIAVKVGDDRRFWIGDLDQSRMYEITATLRLQTEHLQMWVHDQVEVEQSAIERSGRAFEEIIYPTDHQRFGREWIPGVDGDPHVLVLNALFSGATGYFSSVNEHSRLVNPYSNECEMFVVNVGMVRPGTPDYDSVVAHELQHLIHWHLDSNEEAWLNEGASELAEDVSGYGPSRSSIHQYELAPDVQLNAWSEDEAQLGAHYGAAYLMMRYFLDRFGPEMVRELVQSPLNGLASFVAVLERHGAGSFDDLFADWVVANTLDRPELDDGQFGYPWIEVGVESRVQVVSYPYSHTGQVHQYAADYFHLSPPQAGALRISFWGSPRTRLVPNQPASGRFQWWSNRGDASHSLLERPLDLTGVATATLSFDLWYDIEPGWDYAHVRVSPDGGKSWELLRGAHMTDYDPNGNALGPGYTGKSGSVPGTQTDAGPIWVREELDLEPYCGGRVLLRFDYVTDEAVNRPGLCLDNLELASIGLADDVEGGEGGWRARGFIRHDNLLPQGYIVQVIELGEETGVRRLPVGADGRGEWTIDGFGGGGEGALLIVSATAPVTTEMAPYRLEIELVAVPGEPSAGSSGG